MVWGVLEEYSALLVFRVEGASAPTDLILMTNVEDGDDDADDDEDDDGANVCMSTQGLC